MGRRNCSWGSSFEEFWGFNLYTWVTPHSLFLPKYRPSLRKNPELCEAFCRRLFFKKQEISSYGETSFIPGPPLDKIKIEIISKTWYSKELGIVKYKREEKSDSATTGNIYYNKTLLVD